MKFYEALTELNRTQKGYVVETHGGNYYCVYQFDKDGKIRSTTLYDAIKGNQGYLLSFIYMNTVIKRKSRVTTTSPSIS